MITKFKQFNCEKISESVIPNRNRKILFEDEYGKNIVYSRWGEYRIAVDNPKSVSYITLWWLDTKNKWVKVGFLQARETNIKTNGRNGIYLNVSNVHIEPKHRKKGLGYEMFKVLIDFSDDYIKGIVSYLPNRSNKKQIPKIYKKFGSFVEKDTDYQFIDFEKQHIENDNKI